MSLEILLREFFGFKKLAYSSYQEDLDSYGMFLNDPSKSQVLMEEDKSYYSETRAHFDENSINSYIEPQDLYLLKENLKKVTEVIRSYPETQFYIFCPPYSITLFRKCHQKGLLNNFLAKHLIIMEELLKFKNVSLFNFLNKEAIIMNLNNYRDKTHYWKEINEKMIYSFKNNESRISNKEEALKSIHDLCNMVNKSNAFRQSQKENQPKISSG
ncbi:MAG: hypothetical protein K2P93_07005 [Alphaproteobacteria bacterium]|nr:hypothetical protein [Alphaproteobacteria bacterium]